MAGLGTAIIPGFYREVFVALCPSGSTGREGSQSKIDKDIWLKCFGTSTVSDTVLGQIWCLCDPTGCGYISRDGLYKSLVLLALAQQGKAVDEKSLSQVGASELPIPVLRSMSELQEISLSLLQPETSSKLTLTYEQIKAMDDITVTLIPERKGVVFKHVEYLVESKELKSSVRRRYRDFEALYELLISMYPYRLVPHVPPKKLISTSSVFVEQRRRALKRFLTLLVRHPTLSKDDIIKFFLTAGGHEVGTRLKDKFRNSADEYYNHPDAEKAEELVSEETRIKFDRVREQILLIHKIVSSMLEVAHNMENRSLAFSSEMKQFATNMSTLSNDSVLMTSWTSGSAEKWTHMQRDCNSLSGMFTSLSDTAHQQGVRETSGFTESVNLFLDLITSYQDLCERRERTVQRRHQKALAKVHTLVSYKGRMEAQGKHISEKDDGRIVKRDDDLLEIEKRNFFSLYCLDLEAQLIHVNLSQLGEIFKHLVQAQVRGHTEVDRLLPSPSHMHIGTPTHTQYLSAWEEIKGVVDGMGGVRSPSLSSVSSPESSLTALSKRKEHSRSPFI